MTVKHDGKAREEVLHALISLLGWLAGWLGVALVAGQGLDVPKEEDP